MIELLLVLWLAFLFWEIGRAGRGRGASVGLVASWMAVLTISHWFGALIYVLPWGGYLPDYDQTIRGFVLSAWGLIALWLGARVVAPFLLRRRWRSAQASVSPEDLYAVPHRYILVGGILVGVLFPLIGDFPTVTAITSTGMFLVLAGICMLVWRYCRSGHRARLLLVLGGLFLLPLLTLVLTENVIRAVAAILFVLIFAAMFYTPRWQVAIAAAVLIYAGLSFGVSYLSARTDLRETLRESTVAEKFERTLSLFTHVRAFDLSNPDQLIQVNSRMNQNILVGATLDNFEAGGAEFVHGETLWMAALALVPRVLWPDKPLSAGSMGMMSTYTGLTFGETTSVGLGPIIELYANFGTLGVTVGMLLLGALIGTLDLMAFRALEAGQLTKFATYFGPGMGLIQSEGSFVEVTVTCVTILILVAATNKSLQFSHKAKARNVIRTTHHPRYP